MCNVMVNLLVFINLTVSLSYLFDKRETREVEVLPTAGPHIEIESNTTTRCISLGQLGRVRWSPMKSSGVRWSQIESDEVRWIPVWSGRAGCPLGSCRDRWGLV